MRPKSKIGGVQEMMKNSLGSAAWAGALNPPRLCKAQTTRRVEPRAVKPEPCTNSCTMYILCVKTQELTLVSFFQRLQNCTFAGLWFSLGENTPRRGKCVFYLGPTHSPPLPPTPVLEGVWNHFRAWKCIGAQGCVLLAPGRAQSAPQSAPRRAKVSKGTSKARF